MISTPNQPRRVAITGLGVISPLGNSVSQLWDSLTQGRSGVAPLSHIPPLKDRVVFGGECRDFTGDIDSFGPLEKDAKKSIRKALKVMCRETMMAVASSQQAVFDAKLAGSDIDPERCGIVFGSDYMLSPPGDFTTAMIKCGADEGKFRYSAWGEAGLRDMNPLWMLKYLPNMPASHIAIFNDFRGPNNSLTLREISGLMSIREATHTIQRGHADVMIAGATGTRIHAFKTVHAVQTGDLANTGCEPIHASRPFDADRTGMVVGEGSGAIVLEELESARRRGAKIYGEVVGTGSSMVADAQLSGQHRQALANAITTAVAESEIAAERLGHINAHGLATRNSDVEEAAALTQALGDGAQSLPTVAVKSYFGNLGAGSGMVELLSSLLSLGEGELFGTLNYETPDPACPLHLASERGLPAGESFLKVNLTPQAQAAAVVISRCD